jgi:hypothetical protein
MLLMDSQEWEKLQQLARDIRLLEQQVQDADVSGHFALANTLRYELARLEERRETLVDRIYGLVAKDSIGAAANET